MNKSILSFSSIGVLACIFLLFNALSNSLLSRFSVDLTQEGLYSLSDGTERVLEKVSEPIVIKYYYSKLKSTQNAAIQLYATRVRDLLREYARKGGSMITLEEYDPQPDSEEEEWAGKYGLKPLTLATGERLFFGMVAINAKGDEEAIPLFNMNRQETLEYDVTKTIYALSRDTLPKVAILSSLNLEGSAAPRGPNGMPVGPEEDPWVLTTQLASLANLEYLKEDASTIPSDTDVLLLIHPKELSEQTRYAIDQYVMGGGSLFIAQDPYCASDIKGIDPNNPMSMIEAKRSSNVNELTKGWGITLPDNSVVGDPTLSTAVTAARGQAPQDFLVWLSFSEPRDDSGAMLLNPDQVITSQLGNLLFAWSGRLETTEVEGVTISPLVQTSAKAGLYSADKIKFIAQNPQELLKTFQSSQEQQTIAAIARGKFKSSFSGRPGDSESKNESTIGGHIPESVKDATVVVVADVDFLSNNYAAMIQNIMGYNLVTLLNENLAFAANSVELLAGSDDLIGLRSRGSFLRPFTKVKEIEAQAQERWRAEEVRLQTEADEANRRLQQIQSVGGENGEAVFSQALIEEMNQLREQRRLAAERLREVRWQLRKDKERLGNILFAINTFAVPLILIAAAIYGTFRRRATARSA